MLVFPGMLVTAAEKAGLKTPPNPDDYDPDEFPHFAVFCNAQLGRRMRIGEHWTNAEVIAKIPDEKIKSILPAELLAMGFEF